MRVLVTGGAEVIGSNPVERLSKNDNRSTGMTENVESSRVKADE